MIQSNSFKALKHLVSLFLFAFSLVSLSFQAQADDLLEVDQAFSLQKPVVENGAFKIEWKIADGYYLYKKRVNVAAEGIDLGSPQFSKSKLKDDPIFGESEVFYHQLTVSQPYQGSTKETTLTIEYQGCAEKQGVCYPPQKRTFNLAIPDQSATSTEKIESLSGLNELLNAGSGDELLPADEAFKLTTSTDGSGALLLNFYVADTYHLYKDKIEAKLKSGNADIHPLILPAAVPADDPVFGDVEVYKQPFQAKLPITNAQGTFDIEMKYQGCSDAAGVCYPPETKIISINADEIGSASSITSSPSSSELSETDQITQTLQNSSLWIVIGTFFVFGLLLSLTPCVFPMIPILSSIIAGQGESLTTRKAFTMSLVYVLAMSVTYTVAGVLAGLFGENLQVMFQNPWIIGSFALIFVALAFSMFGFYELQLPSALQSKITNLSNKQQGGTMTGVAIMGFLSALIVGPCVAPPLAGALIYIGQTGDALLGGAALFAMSLGMGIPLLLIGVSAGKLLPRAGAWMDNVKAIFGVLMLGVAIWMAERILPGSVTLFLWSALLIGSAIYLGALEPVGEKSGWHKLAKSLGIILLAYGILLLVGMAGGSKDVLQPLKVYQGGSSSTTQASEKLPFKTIKSLAELKEEVSKGHPVMLDFYADWCISCKEMEKFTFSDANIKAALSNVTLLKADVTANDAIDKELMKAFNIIGPPAILFFNQGEEKQVLRVVGFKKPEEFIQNIEKAFK